MIWIIALPQDLHTCLCTVTVPPCIHFSANCEHRNTQGLLMPYTLKKCSYTHSGACEVNDFLRTLDRRIKKISCHLLQGIKNQASHHVNESPSILRYQCKWAPFGAHCNGGMLRTAAQLEALL